ncbi:gamma-glutamylcyclotransferase [Larsenimonas salina]|uniref:gamma-glutamylcyclotransferase n=1 Tax=Larsenimonas salina TaxID=1295565 RepID=UPI0020742E4F|nr:gamma-glutamylcyclotransferase [Larsenimonas salina]MCM5704180.1 gamma-glutamylcyclotransferase [Larsenimonas salina]
MIRSERNAIPSLSITRDVLERDQLRAHFARHHPEIETLDDTALTASIRTLLDHKPVDTDTDGVFLFAYGSLIWNPCVAVGERRAVRLHGYHRAFCLRFEHGRGSLEASGLMLGLVDGGHCQGMALEIPGDQLEHELLLVWRREMLTGAYVPRWVSLESEAGLFSAIAFIANSDDESFVGELTDEETIEMLARGAGTLGTCRDYLSNTVTDLRALGIHDAQLEVFAHALGVTP